MSRPWQGEEVLLVGHSQMEGFGPLLQERFERTGAKAVHLHAERGANIRKFRRDIYAGYRPIPAALSDTIPVVVVALSGNGAVTDSRELAGNLDFIRAEYPRALIFWLGHTVTITGDPEADAERARAAELEARTVPDRPGFVFVDMRLAAELAPDGLHYTARGYRQLAAHAWRQILAATAPEPQRFPWFALGGCALLGGALGYGARKLRDRRAAGDEDDGGGGE